MFFKKKNSKDKLAFGRIPAYCKYELYMERYRSASEIIKKHITLNEKSKLLDIGSGFGRMKYFFNKNEGTWYGIEISKKRAEKCKSLGYTIVEIDINKDVFPWSDNFFDVVFASHVVEHLSNIDFALKQFDRVLKKGGVLLIAVPSKLPPFHTLINFYYFLKKMKLGATQNAFSVWSIKKKAREILGDNYHLVDCRGFSFFSARTTTNLEDKYWFYRMNTLVGKVLPAITPEVNLIYIKT